MQTIDMRDRRAGPTSGGSAAGSEQTGAVRRTAPARPRWDAVGLGCFGVALGLGQLFVPAAIASIVGARPTRRTRTTMRLFGARELASGLGILASVRPAPWLWARLAGDAVDLFALVRTLRLDRAQKARTAGALAAGAAVTLLDANAALALSRRRAAELDARSVRVRRSVTVIRPREEVYRFWHDFENLPRFMAHLESVRVVDGRSLWRARGPLGTALEWEAEITADEPNELIAWRSTRRAMVPYEGSVRFLPALSGRGTEVRVELGYLPTGGALGATLAKLFGQEPGQKVKGDLRRFKQVMETGEVLHSDASIHRGRHPARPSARGEQSRQVSR